MKLSAAEIVIRELGGVRAAARELGCHPSNVSRWKKANIPNRYHRKILELARSRKLKITAEDLIMGRA